uniref:non-specific serine/threonine protein kinase n=1 Tax=Opuntia streptacantha TaxID=393608 RepID=A0A7C9EAN2_OPUST
MWRFKPFTQKEQTGLEGCCIDVGDIKIHIKNVIAEGGFSCVYLAKDASNASKQYALKHIICNDKESLDLAMKEIQVMKSLRGHPNIVTLYAHTILDKGRTKEALLVMEFCERSLVYVLESRGAGYFEEKQVLTIFRDVCNAVFAMHCQSPPIAHRDLKAENLLLGSDGLWKLCDFGSTSTNHKRFEKPEEMGVEEDNIRKHTTPAYRAPEMWDLYRRDLINEKVDIWALGCLLYRICYLKSAFDGESKLQILNGNYRIPDSPKYSAFVADLIRDMLQSSPDLRPDITQVWFRVNEQLPVGLQKSLPDRPPQMSDAASDITEGISKTTYKASNPRPRRSPPPVPSSNESTRNTSPPSAAKGNLGGASLGAFWSTEHAKDSLAKEDKNAPKFVDESPSMKEDIGRSEKHRLSGKASPSGRETNHPTTISGGDVNRSSERSKEVKSSGTVTSLNDAFNTFVAEFDSSKLSPGVGGAKLGKDDSLVAEIERLREQLKQANLEKAEITSKYEKLAAICRSQRQEIQELKQTLAARTPSPNKESLKNHSSSTNQSVNSQSQKIEGTAWELQQGLFNKSPTTPEPKAWQAFADNSDSQASVTDFPKSVRSRNGHQNKQNASAASNNDAWGFESESFTAVPAANSRVSRSTGEGNTSQRFGGSNNLTSKTASQPAGWAGF